MRARTSAISWLLAAVGGTPCRAFDDRIPRGLCEQLQKKAIQLEECGE